MPQNVKTMGIKRNSGDDNHTLRGNGRLSTGLKFHNWGMRHKISACDRSNIGRGSVRDETVTLNTLPLQAELDTITGAFSLRNEKGENRVSTRKQKNLPQRSDGDTSQAGCRGFESRPPLHENRIAKRKMTRGPVDRRPSLAKCAQNVPGFSYQRRGRTLSLSSEVMTRFWPSPY